jgi:hypothetical protein
MSVKRARLQPALQLQPSPRLDYYKYRDRGHLKALTGRDTNGFADAGTTRFHTIWPTDNHEGVHTVVILQMGHPPPLFTEGIAVAHQTNPPQGILRPRWNGTDLHVLARQYDAAGRLAALRSLLRSSDFFDFDSNVMYPCAGSFVLYLIDSQGLVPLKKYFATATVDDARVDDRITLPRRLRSPADGGLGRVAGVDQIAAVTPL